MVLTNDGCNRARLGTCLSWMLTTSKLTLSVIHRTARSVLRDLGCILLGSHLTGIGHLKLDQNWWISLLYHLSHSHAQVGKMYQSLHFCQVLVRWYLGVMLTPQDYINTTGDQVCKLEDGAGGSARICEICTARSQYLAISRFWVFVFIISGSQKTFWILIFIV